MSSIASSITSSFAISIASIGLHLLLVLYWLASSSKADTLPMLRKLASSSKADTLPALHLLASSSKAGTLP